MDEDIRIVLIGQAAFGESVLNALVEQGENVTAVFCPPDKDGARADPLKVAAQKHGVSVHQFKRMRNQDAIDAFKSLKTDLGVMAFVTDIVPLDIIDAPTHGTINFHPSLLPKHRGPSSINWPIIQGETKTGLSVFWPDAGLDTGPILLQREVKITPDDTLGTVYFKKIFDLGVTAIVEAISLVKDGAAPKIEQDESQATYEGWCKAKDVIIDWTKPIGEVYNLVRGSDPSPGAGTSFNGKGIRFYSASKTNGDSGAEVGVVVELCDEGFTVAGEGGSMLVGRVQPEGSKKIPAVEWMAKVGLEVGHRFGMDS